MFEVSYLRLLDVVYLKNHRNNFYMLLQFCTFSYYKGNSKVTILQILVGEFLFSFFYFNFLSTMGTDNSA